VLIYRQAMSA